MRYVRLILCHDWQGLYINNELMCENHSLSSQEVITHLMGYYDYYFYEPQWLTPEQDEKLSELGGFPDTWKEFNEFFS